MKRNLSSSPKIESSSLANKYGVAIKQNHSLGSMGLNPNLNIEDEYIENLLKQIHFMNMQIKLIKEKQSQSDNNALWAIISRSNQPMVNNIVESSQKCQQMKKDIDSSVYKLEKDITKLQNDQGALKKEISFLENKRAEIQIKQNQWDQQCRLRQQELDNTIKNNEGKLKNILDQLQKEKKKNKQLHESQFKHVSEQESSRQKNKRESIQIKNDQTIEQMIENDLVGQISVLKLMTDGLIKKFEEDIQYLKAKQQNQEHKIKVAQLQKNIAGSYFQILQLNESIKMAGIQKDKQIAERKRITQQYEQKKAMLAQIIKLNQIRKQKQTINKKKQCVQISKAEEQTIKLQKSLDEIKKKLVKSQEANFVVQGQVSNFNRQLEILTQNQKNLLQKIHYLRSQNAQSDNKLARLKNQLSIKQDVHIKTLNEETNKKIELLELEKELQYLRGRRDLLDNTFQLKDVINKISIDQLQKVVMKNNELNSTVSRLMTKWEEIRDFSKA